MTYEEWGKQGETLQKLIAEAEEAKKYKTITQIHTIKGPNAEKRVNEWAKGEDIIDIKTTLVDRDIWYTIIYRRRVKK